MKRIFIIFLFALGIPLYFACEEDNIKVDRDCGCDTDSIVFTFNNREGLFGSGMYESLGGWTISVKDIGPQFMNGRVCNMEHPTIKAVIDTFIHTSHLPVRFWGRIKRRCPEEYAPFAPANVSFYHLTVDSLKLN